MNGELVNPNWHVLLVHFPIGLVFAGVLIELFSFLGWRRSSFRTAGRWMILLGTLAAVPTALSGAFALQQMARVGVDPVIAGGHWHELLGASPLVHMQHGEAWEHLVDHTYQQSFATGALLLAVLIWLSCSDQYRIKLHVPIFIIALAGTALMAWGAWNGGESVYAHGVGVGINEEVSPISPTQPAMTKAITGTMTSTTQEMDEHEHHLESRLGFYAPPMQMHVIFAGLTISLAVVALGLGIRGATTVGKPVRDMDDLAAALGPMAANDPYISTEDSAALRDAARTSHEHTPPSARFWLLAMLLGIITATIGVYLLASPHHGGIGWNFSDLLSQVRNPDQNPNGPMKLTRRFAHLIAGGSIVVLALLLAICGRFAPRRKFLVLFLGLILLAAAAAQVWIGILLLYDTNSGRLDGFM